MEWNTGNYEYSVTGAGAPHCAPSPKIVSDVSKEVYRRQGFPREVIEIPKIDKVCYLS
jgi:hypothetical protein